MDTRIETALRVMRLYDSFDGPSGEGLWWRTDNQYSPVTMFVNCNDLFWWGSADCERVTAENVGELERAVADIAAIDDCLVDDAGILWVARQRGMRPQGAYYKHIDAKLHHLFDACGEPRETGLGNPLPAQLSEKEG